MDQNVPGQSHCRSFKSTISFLYADTNSWKLTIEKFYMVKKSVATTVTRKVKVTLIGLLGHGTLKSAVSWEWIDEIADFLHTDTNLRKLKVT